jgi:Fe2+ or Zn2+ uptake regulation protein
MSYSKQREIVLAQLRKNKTHPTADDVYSALKPDNPGLSLATVYRNLNLLFDLGIIGRVGISGKAERFDSNPEDHCHVICVHCGEIIDIEDELPERLCEKARKATDYAISGCSVVFFGSCPKCADKAVEAK